MLAVNFRTGGLRMGSTFTFRSARRLAAVAMIAAIVFGCGAKVAVDRDGGVIGYGGAGGEGTYSTGTGFGGSGAKDGGSCALTSTGVGAGQSQTTACFPTPADGCPNQYDAVLHIVPSSSCVYLVSVDCGPVASSSKCCYLVTEEAKPCEG
ncbi:Hypothetical protein A7982_11177 [Minicystis rosea]|nr:Hypothetical protein A7982_11177 [Minicystis rosea]